jgi:hypothetical protein
MERVARKDSARRSLGRPQAVLGHLRQDFATKRHPYLRNGGLKVMGKRAATTGRRTAAACFANRSLHARATCLENVSVVARQPDSCWRQRRRRPRALGCRPTACPPPPRPSHVCHLQVSASSVPNFANVRQGNSSLAAFWATYAIYCCATLCPSWFSRWGAVRRTGLLGSPRPGVCPERGAGPCKAAPPPNHFFARSLAAWSSPC